MPRPKEFDTDKALDAAMHLFWRQGYEATSMSDLLAAMGIGRQSLYDTFGDKHQLFIAALRRYRSTMMRPVLKKLEAQDASLAEIRAYFERTLIAFSSKLRRACLMVNTTMELGGRDKEATDEVAAGVGSLKAALLNALQNAVDRGELELDDVDATAWMLTAAAQGLAVLGKGGVPRQVLELTVRETLDRLD